MWDCLCDCGKASVVRGHHLVCGEAKSCGCFRDEESRIRNITHGMKKTRVYRIWSGMLSRCSNPNTPQYQQYYGGHGITVCDRWKSFDLFFEDMGIPPEKHQIDRKEGSKGYSPDNCRWATSRENNQNRRDNRLLVCDGLSLPLAEWERRLGMSRGLLHARIDKYKWDVDRAIKTPVRIGAYKRGLKK